MIPPTVREMLDDLRDAGMACGRIGRAIGVSEFAVWAWAKGKHKPTPYARRRLEALHSHLAAWSA